MRRAFFDDEEEGYFKKEQRPPPNALAMGGKRSRDLLSHDVCLPNTDLNSHALRFDVKL